MRNIVQLIYEDEDLQNQIPLVAVKNKVLAKNTVKIVCGGGVGHEPANAGFVCDQMLHGAIVGMMWSIPTLSQVRKAFVNIIADS